MITRGPSFAGVDLPLLTGSGTFGFWFYRACLIREVLTLLCKLSLHANHSHTVLALLTVDKETTRLALGAMNQLISGGPCGPSADLVELARGLQKRILMELPGYQESS